MNNSRFGAPRCRVAGWPDKLLEQLLEFDDVRCERDRLRLADFGPAEAPGITDRSRHDCAPLVRGACLSESAIIPEGFFFALLN